MYYLLSERANCERRIVTENHPTVQMHIKEAIKLGVTPRTPEEIIKWMWGYEKKSDNVYDLIDRENDLVKIDVLGYYNIVEAKTLNGDWRNNHKIVEIYKPNSKGDYIKVWECGE